MRIEALEVFSYSLDSLLKLSNHENLLSTYHRLRNSLNLIYLSILKVISISD